MCIRDRSVINDSAHGLGLELILASDVRICALKSEFSMPHVAHGVIPSDGGTQRLPRLVGQGRALEIILTSRVVGAQEALEIGRSIRFVMQILLRTLIA